MREELGDEIAEANQQLAKQVARYRELQITKAEEPRIYIFLIASHYTLLIDPAELFYLEDNQALQNVDVITDAGESVISTTFTRYTATVSATSRTSKRVAVLVRGARD